MRECAVSRIETETAFNATTRRPGIPPFDLGEKSPAKLLLSLPCHEGALKGTVNQLNRASVMKAQHRRRENRDSIGADIKRIEDNELGRTTKLALKIGKQKERQRGREKTMHKRSSIYNHDGTFLIHSKSIPRLFQ